MYIYRKHITLKKLIYFTKYRMQVLKSRNYIPTNGKCKFFIRLNKNKDKKEIIKNYLSQKFLFDESNKYTYFPQINNYNLVMQKYNSFNNQFYPIVDNQSERFQNIKLGNSNNNININITSRINNDKNNSYILNLIKSEGEKCNRKKNIKNNYTINYISKIPISNKRRNILGEENKYISLKKNNLNKISRNLLTNRINTNISHHRSFQVKKFKPKLINKDNISFYKNISFSLDKNHSKKRIIKQKKEINIPQSESSFTITGANRKNKSRLSQQIYRNRINFLKNKSNNKIDSLNTKLNSISTYNNSISQIENLDLNLMTSKNNKSILIPSKTNSITLTLNNNGKDKNYQKNIIPKKLNIKKMSNEQLKKLKIFKRFKIGKKLRKITLSKIKILNLTNNLTEESNNLQIITDKSINNSTNKKNMRETIIQTVTDEKMMEIAGHYLNNDETVDRILIDDILLSKKK